MLSKYITHQETVCDYGTHRKTNLVSIHQETNLVSIHQETNLVSIHQETSLVSTLLTRKQT